MQLIYYPVPGGNFGDDLNGWIWDELLPGWQDWAPSVSLVGVGTILQRALVGGEGRKLVIGSGVGYGETVNVHENPDQWDIRAVRGPKSAAALGLHHSKGIIDPAAMLPRLASMQTFDRTGDTLFVPHHLSIAKYDWTAICEGTGIKVLDPRKEARQIIWRIAGARRVIAESMHAAIIADAFRVPWQAVAISDGFNTFKWDDWGESLDMPIQVNSFFPTLRRIQALVKALQLKTKAKPDYRAEQVKRNVELAPQYRQILPIIARKAIKRISLQKYHLSNETNLGAQQDKFQKILDDVRSEYSKN